MKDIWILLFGLILWIGCTDNEADTEAPTIEIIESSTPQVSREVCGVIENNVFQVQSDQSFALDLKLEDNEALGELKVDVHSNFDCHGHGGQAPSISPPDIPGTTVDWTELETIRLSGTSEEQTVMLNPPENATVGNYHLSLIAVDANGNQTDFSQIFNVQLQNSADTISPQLIINGQLPDGESYARGTNMKLDFEVSDNRNLNLGGNGLVYLSYKGVNSSFWTTGTYQVFEEAQATIQSSIDWEIPTTLTDGRYEILVEAFDGVRNRSETVAFELIVTD